MGPREFKMREILDKKSKKRIFSNEVPGIKCCIENCSAFRYNDGQEATVLNSKDE